MVIAVTGIIAGIVAMFIKQPVENYYDSVRRAELTDVADTAVRRMARDIQGALPNSVRVAGGNSIIEFVPIKAAGRYRSEVGSAPSDDPLDFSSASDNSFDVLGAPVTVANGDQIVIYNMGITGSDVYEGSSRRTAAIFGTLAKVTYNPAGAQFPFSSPGYRFQVVSTAVSYACDLANATLWRYSGYAIQLAQASTMAALDSLGGVTKAALATKLTACSITYNPGALQRAGLVSIGLSLSDGGETVSLLHQVNVINTP